MALFDFLNTQTGAGTPNFINPDTGVLARDPGTGFDLGSLLGGAKELFKDPNFLQALGNVGQSISAGDTIGEALNPADLIRQIQSQKAGQQILGQTLPGQAPPAQATPTPLGQAGPDSVTTKRTADGTTTTVVEPSAKNLNTFGTNVPLEAQPSSVATPTQAGSGGSNLPFFQALFQ